MENIIINLIIEYINNVWNMLSELSLYILSGLFIAGIINEILSGDFIRKHLGGNNSSSVFKSVLIGIPLPVCSCSVIPIGVSLKKSGANIGSVLAFLIATPVTGIDSIIVTYGVFGPVFTAIRVVSSVIISIVAGLLGNKFIKENHEEHKVRNIKRRKIKFKRKNIFELLKRIYDYAVNDLLPPLAKPILYGVLLGAFISLIPININTYVNNLLIQYILVLLLATPLYICSISSIPVAISLMSIGFSPGAALIFMTSGPATNIVTITTIYKLFGKKSIIIYLSCVILGSFLFALLVDLLMGDLSYTHIMHDKKTDDLLSTLATIILLIYIFRSIFINKNKANY